MIQQTSIIRINELRSTNRGLGQNHGSIVRQGGLLSTRRGARCITQLVIFGWTAVFIIHKEVGHDGVVEDCIVGILAWINSWTCSSGHCTGNFKYSESAKSTTQLCNNFFYNCGYGNARSENLKHKDVCFNYYIIFFFEVR